MEESHGEGLASHTGPSHAPVPARAGAKRWFWGTCRPGMEPRNRTELGVPTLEDAGRPHWARRYREAAFSASGPLPGNGDATPWTDRH